MSPAAVAIFEDWSLPIGITVAILLISAIYVRGWIAIRKTRPEFFTGSRLWSFLSAMALLWLAIGSPMDGFADTLLSAHMFQHFLLMSAVPPLVWLSAPVVPMLRGLPRWTIRWIVGPIIRQRWIRSTGEFITAPVFAWLSFNLVFLGWHIPAAYDLALSDERIHDFEHICFLTTALLFWYVVLYPWPARARAGGWAVMLYLLFADIINTALSAFLAFCNRPIYQFYFSEPNPFHISAMNDQAAGGVIMWVLNSFVFLVPAMLLAVKMAGFGYDEGGQSLMRSAPPVRLARALPRKTA